MQKYLAQHKEFESIVAGGFESTLIFFGNYADCLLFLFERGGFSSVFYETSDLIIKKNVERVNSYSILLGGNSIYFLNKSFYYFYLRLRYCNYNLLELLFYDVSCIFIFDLVSKIYHTHLVSFFFNKKKLVLIKVGLFNYIGILNYSLLFFNISQQIVLNKLKYTYCNLMFSFFFDYPKYFDTIFKNYNSQFFSRLFVFISGMLDFRVVDSVFLDCLIKNGYSFCLQNYLNRLQIAQFRRINRSLQNKYLNSYKVFALFNDLLVTKKFNATKLEPNEFKFSTFINNEDD
jgi:hypothetical protein